MVQVIIIRSSDANAETNSILLAKDTTMDACKGKKSIRYQNHEYKLVAIGTQCWFAENLNVGIQIYGVTVPEKENTIEKYCYDDMKESCDTYGALYSWDEAMAEGKNGKQGICPEGWHIPDANDWSMLANTLGGSDVAGGKIKSPNAGGFCPPNPRETPYSGFNGIGTGCRYAGDCTFCFHKIYGAFWSSSDISDEMAILRCIHFDDTSLGENTYDKKHGFAVRCVKD